MDHFAFIILSIGALAPLGFFLLRPGALMREKKHAPAAGAAYGSIATWFAGIWRERCRIAKALAAGAGLMLASASPIFAQSSEEAGGEASLKLPDFTKVQFLGVDGHKLLMFGILFCIFGLIFGLVIYSRLKGLPVHQAMKEMSQLIWETCKTYLVTQGKFLALLWIFIAVIIVVYFGVLLKLEAMRVAIILAF